MTRHQFIITSCRTNIERAGPGEKIYTYTKGFGEIKQNPVYSPLLKYRYPRDPDLDAPIEETIEYMPKSFIFKNLDDGCCAFSRNAYSGYDYSGPDGGRRGNILKHGIICENNDIVHYPCEYFNSSMFCKYISYDQLNSDDVPDYMPEPEIIPGSTVTIDTVKDFLCCDKSREEIFMKMVSALVTLYKSGRKPKKRIVICDVKENIIFWIAAIEYVFPIEIAKTIDFNTYVYNPMDSNNPIICGVFPEGTDYESSNIDLINQTYLFDLKNNIIPDVPIDESFYSFIADGLCFDYSESYNIIIEFHNFINKLSANTSIAKFPSSYSYYNLYTHGIDFIDTKQEFENAVDYIQTLSDYNSRRNELYNMLLNEIDKLYEKTDDELILSVLSFLCENTYSEEFPKSIKDLTLKLIISQFNSQTVSEKSFVESFNLLNEKSKGKFSIIRELSKELINNINSDSEEWKLDFVFKLLTDYNTDIETLYETVSIIEKNNGIDESKKNNSLCMLYSTLSKEDLIKFLDISIEKSVVLPEILVKECIKRIPLKEPSTEDFEILKKLVNYLTLVRDKKSADKLLLLVIGMNIRDVNEKNGLSEAVNTKISKINNITVNRANLDSFSKGEIDDYLMWIASISVPKSKKEADFTSVYGLYEFTPERTSIYLHNFTSLLIKKKSSRIDCERFSEYLKFISMNKLDTKENLKGMYNDIDKASYNEINEHITKVLKGDKALSIWNEITKIRESKSPFLEFKKKFIKFIK